MSVKKRAGVFVTALLLSAGIFLSALPLGPAAAASRYEDNPVVEIVKNVSAAVVNIDIETVSKRSALPLPFDDDPVFRRFFGDRFDRFSRSVPMKGRGSGFIVTKDGQILTNNHVVDGADKITVTLSNGKTYPAEVLGKDPTFDLAVIKIKPNENLTVLELSDSDAVEVGEWVVAIGNPFGLEHTVTVGVISAKNRSVHARDINFDGFLQTDAAINPGNSGGPLIDMQGKVVGINTAIVPYAQGLGFAIPVNVAKQIMGDLVAYGKVKRGWLGVSVQSLTQEFAEAYSIDAESGVVIGDVFSGSAAERAGLRRGDVVVSIGNEAVKDVQSFVNSVRAQAPGATLRLKVIREGKSITVTAKLDEMPASEGGGLPSEPSSGEGALENVGIAVSGLTPEMARRYRLDRTSGLVVVEVAENSPAQFAGVRQGDLILEVNGRKVIDLSSLDSALKRKGSSVVLLIERDAKTFFVSLKPGP
jgi:serine protease Do